MHTLTDQTLLDIWEQGSRQPLYRRALLLLAAAVPGLSVDEVAALPIGQRDRMLFELRERLFGPRLESVVDCPHCGARLELAFNVADLLAPAVPGAEDTFKMQLDAYAVTFRLPNSQDLALAAGAANPHRLLMERCVVGVWRDDVHLAATDLPDEAYPDLSAQMALCDPQAEVQLNMHCPDCDRGWDVLFDIVTYLWAELNRWALRTLGEIHVLARAYGWREADVLALSRARRQMYISMVTGG